MVNTLYPQEGKPSMTRPTKKNNTHSEIEDKRRIAINDFNRLIVSGKVGFFSSCEITQLFLFDKDTKEITNFFTLACFSEKNSSSIKKTYLTPKLITINDKRKMGLVQFHLPIEDAESLFDNVRNGCFQIGSDVCKISQNMVLLPKQYVPQSWGLTGPAINNILKPNFYGENYILEFFDEEKGVIESLPKNDFDLDKIYRRVNECSEISIDLSSVYDRIGGIIFQFPITVLTCDPPALNGNSNSIKLQFNRHPNLGSDISLCLTAKTSIDEVVTGFRTVACNTSDKTLELELGDSDNMEVFVAEKDSDILLYHTKVHFLREIRMTKYLSMEHAEPRTITASDKGPVESRVALPMPIHVGRRRANEYRDCISHRVLEKEILTNSGDYHVAGKGQRQIALEYIRHKLRSLSRLKEICLWDPYLNVQDIVDTLYFEPTGVPFRCISSLNGLKNSNRSEKDETSQDPLPVTFEIIKQRQRKQLGQLSNNLRVKLEFRCQHNNYGYPFHDRFLILVSEKTEALPIAYSLGTSINSVGNKHHLIQKVTNPRIILKNFNALWEELRPEHCRIIILPDELGSLNQ